MLGAASSTSAEGDVALTERDYPLASELFAQAASHVPPGYPDERGNYLARQAGALYQQGDERGDNATLRSAIEVYQQALKELTRARVPLDWAATQMNLGTALERLGERESGTARLEEAVAAYRAALQELTRARVPLEWAGCDRAVRRAALAAGQARPQVSRRCCSVLVAYSFRFSLRQMCQGLFSPSNSLSCLPATGARPRPSRSRTLHRPSSTGSRAR